jgi:hypothetical protein
MTDNGKTGWQTFTEEVEIAGGQLVDEVNRLIADGNVHKIQIATKEGDVFINVPLTAGAVAGGVVMIAAPWLAVIGAIAGVVAHVRVRVVREAEPQQKSTASKSVAQGDAAAGPTAGAP